MERSKPFSKFTHCTSCKRYIDEETVRLKKIVIGGDTFRQYDDAYLDKIKYERLCSDCVGGKI